MLKRLGQIELAICVALLAIITGLVFVASVMRFFGYPLVWSVDLAQLLEKVAPGVTAHRVDPTLLQQDVPVLTDDFAPVDQYLLDLSSPITAEPGR
jgi:hypothetical protein